MKKVYWINYLFVLILIVPIFYFLNKYLNLPLLYNYLITINIAAFIIFGLDKMSARMRGQRIPEIILYALSLLGGFAGAFIGMIFFRHKTSRASFYIFPLLCFILYLAIIYYLN